MNKILSILIPTRNRAIYLMNVVEAILTICCQNFELIIQDNSDDNQLQDLIEEIKDERLIYQHTTEEISFAENFERGLRLCQGEYITIIGDDDGASSELIDLAYYLYDNKIESVSFQTSVSYFWPKIAGLTGDNQGVIQIGDIKCSVKKYPVRHELYRLLQNGGQNYLQFGLPKLYHGIVKRTVIDNIIKHYGTCFDSLSPDIFSTVRLSEFIEINYVTDYPFTIAGSCPASASAASMTGKHEGRLNEAPHFRGFQDYKWSSYVPKFYSVPTIWAESLVYAIKSSKNPELLKYLNIKRIVTYCLEKHPSYQETILGFAKKQKIVLNFYERYLMRRYHGLKALGKRIYIRMEIITKQRDYTKNDQLPDMRSAMNFLTGHQQVKGYSIKKLLQRFEEC